MAAHPFASTLQSFRTASGQEGRFYSLPALAKQHPALSRLPVSIRLVLESVLRNCDGKKVTAQSVREIANWAAKADRTAEVPFVVARIVLQDFTGVPLLVDLAAMRSAVERLGKDAGVIEPLAKAGRLRVVVATMGLAAGINFSLRSVAITAANYKREGIEMPLKADEILQMFGRAGRRGLDETGYVLVTDNEVRLRDGRPRFLSRSAMVDWSALLNLMTAAADAGKNPFGEAVRVQERLFTTKPIFLGVEESLRHPDAPCGLQTDAERARHVRSRVRELYNSRGEWERFPPAADVALKEIRIMNARRQVLKAPVDVATSRDGRTNEKELEGLPAVPPPDPGPAAEPLPEPGATVAGAAGSSAVRSSASAGTGTSSPSTIASKSSGAGPGAAACSRTSPVSGSMRMMRNRRWQESKQSFIP